MLNATYPFEPEWLLHERVLDRRWAPELIVLSYCISWLGAYTSFQLHIHARYTKNGWIWTAIGSLAFGFCAIWSMHFLGMLACGLDVQITLSVPLTILSAAVAVFFTFFAFLSGDEHSPVHAQLSRLLRRLRSHRPKRPTPDNSEHDDEHERDNERARLLDEEAPDLGTSRLPAFAREDAYSTSASASTAVDIPMPPFLFSKPKRPSSRTTFNTTDSAATVATANTAAPSTNSDSPNNSLNSQDSSSLGLDLPRNPDGELDVEYFKLAPVSWREWTSQNIDRASWSQALRAAIWASAIVFMHYCGMWAMEIPRGRIQWHTGLVLLSYAVAFCVCFVACLFMFEMEVHFGRQIAVSTISSLGVCSMHYTGVAAATFYSFAPPSPTPGFPAYLSFAIISIAILVCVVSNAILADSAISARVRMAEMILTKRRLWRIMAEKEAAERARELKQQFISIASHEIRTPLHTVNGYADLLVRSRLTAEQMLYVSSIQQACHAINVIAGNVLDFDKLERDNVEMEAAPVVVDLRKMLEGVSKLATAGDVLSDQPIVDTVVCVTPRVPAAVLIDETYTLRVIMNLYSNAQKFTPSGYINISVDYNPTSHELIVKTSDTGCGIPASLRQTIFEPFRQADSSITRAHTGAGLGLSIVKHLVQRMRGSIEVESVYGEGSTFTVVIPVDAVPPAHVPASGPPTPPTPGEEPKKKRVRVVYTDKRTEILFVQMWRHFGAEASSTSMPSPPPSRRSSPGVGPVPTYNEVTKDTDILWTDVQSLKASPSLSALMNSSAFGSTLLICILHSHEDELLALEPAISSARNVVPLKKPLVMHHVYAMLEDPEGLANARMATNAHRVRFAPLGDDALPMERSQRSPPISPEPPKKKGRVLLVEDNLVNQRLGKRLVEKLGYEVVTAKDGQEAIVAVLDSQFDTCLMDCQMPVLDGFAATRQIREMEQVGTLSGHLFIIALTANVSSDSEEKCRVAGMDHFLPKPLLLDDLELALLRQSTTS